jgi:predicted ATPase with chaperone activity
MDTPMNQPVVRDRCPPPKSVADTEIELNSLLRLLLKTVYVRGLENASQLSSALKLPISVVNELLEEAKERGVLEVLGAAGQRLSAEFRYGITERGRQWASDALDQSLYAGPAPVSLADFHRQIERQRVTEEQVQPDNLVKALSDLVVSRSMIRALGPAVNSGRSVLLYGSPGNGKTTIASILGGVFTDIIHIPYCIEIDGQIIKVFDPTLHQPMEDLTEDLTGAVSEEVSLRTETIDRRWVACKRPLVITGGELTLAMLDLNFNPYSRFYEAPLHMKAIGGTYVIDDLGRQLVRPDDLLNRWIGPMETRVDDAQHRQDLRDPVRRVADLLDQPDARRHHGSGLPAPHSL